MARRAATAKISKTQAYREAEAALGGSAELEAVQQYIREKFQIEMTKQQISQYRSIEKRRSGSSSNGTRRARRAAAPAGDAVLEFVSNVRGWENKLGADKICEVIEALYKKN